MTKNKLKTSTTEAKQNQPLPKREFRTDQENYGDLEKFWKTELEILKSKRFSDRTEAAQQVVALVLERLGQSADHKQKEFLLEAFLSDPILCEELDRLIK